VAQKILVVEDEPSNSLLAEVSLRRLNCQIIVKTNGLSGLDRAKQGDIDLVILDIALPGVGGWEVLDSLRADPATSRTPVLVLTAHAGDESMERAYRAGADAYIEKPYLPEKLRRTAEHLLGRLPANS
jgi:two-component system, sensor histidine kinase and response regulator